MAALTNSEDVTKVLNKNLRDQTAQKYPFAGFHQLCMSAWAGFLSLQKMSQRCSCAAVIALRQQSRVQSLPGQGRRWACAFDHSLWPGAINFLVIGNNPVVMGWYKVYLVTERMFTFINPRCSRFSSLSSHGKCKHTKQSLSHFSAQLSMVTMVKPLFTIALWSREINCKNGLWSLPEAYK